jgi:penicillin amidase
MELLRRIAAGRLSEIFGEDMIKTDKLFLGLGIQAAAERSLKNLDTTQQSYKLTQAYLEGINQFIENGSTPIEFSLLGIDKEKYSMIDIYNVAGYMAFGFAQAHKTDPLLTNIKEELGQAYLKDLDINIDARSTRIYNYPRRNKKLASDLSKSVNEILTHSPTPLFIGSNSWVIGPKKTKNKKVIFANDPHIEFSQPAVWYQSHLITPDYELYGFNLGLSPFPLLGHNREYAYGLTMFENDDIDFYREKDNLKYSIRKETIKVKDGDDVSIEIREGDHGPIMNDFLDILDTESAIAMDWIYTKMDADLIDFSYKISHAKSLSQFKSGIADLHAPGLNVMYGDAKNNIAWFAVGKLYTRSNNVNSKFILDGANGQDDQLNFLNFSQNPQAINPSWNYVYSANNQPDSIAGVLYPGYYVPEDRAKRIVEILKPKNDFTIEDIQIMINDVESSVVPDLLPIIIDNISKVNLSNIEKEAIDILKGWKGEFKTDEIAPTIYIKFIYHLLHNTFADEMGEEGFEQFLKTHLYKRQIAKQIKLRKSIWWDDINTKDIKELKDEIITRSFHQTISELEMQFGDEPDDWTWDKALTVTHKHVFDKVSILRNFFNVGPFKTNGTFAVLNNQGFLINGNGVYSVNSGPSTRRIIDFSDVENGVAIIPTGQSGNVFSKYYKNQSKKYLNGEFVKMMLNEEEIKRSKDKLIFKPLN